MGDPNRCPRGWDPDIVFRGERVGVADRDGHHRKVAGVSSFCHLCGNRWAYPRDITLTEGGEFPTVEVGEQLG